MMFNFLEHLIAFDFAWIIELIMNNLLITFGVIAMAFFFSEKKNLKNVFLVFLLIVFAVWGAVDFAHAAGFIYLTGGYLLIDYISRIVVIGFAETVESLKNKLFIVNVARYWVVIILFNIALIYFMA